MQPDRVISLSTVLPLTRMLCRFSSSIRTGEQLLQEP